MSSGMTPGKMNPEDLRDYLRSVVRERRGWFIGIGVVMIVLGLVCAAMPALGTLAAETVLAYVLFVAGVVTGLKAFSVPDWGGRVGQLLLAILYIVVAVLLLSQPVAGAQTLTVIVAAYFLADGAIRLYIAFRVRHGGQWFWPLLAALCSLALGVIIVASYPFSATWVLGLLAGINFLFIGTALLAVAGAAGKQ